MNTLDKAFSGKWITLDEIRAFGKSYEKEFGNTIGLAEQGKYINLALGEGRIKRTLKGGVQGALTGVLSGTIQKGVGDITGYPSTLSLKQNVILGAGIGSGVGAASRNYMVIFLNDAWVPDYLIVQAIGEKMAIWIVKKYYKRSSRFEAFKFPEEIKDINNYVQELVTFANRVKRSKFKAFRFPENIEELRKLEQVSLVN